MDYQNLTGPLNHHSNCTQMASVRKGGGSMCKSYIFPNAFLGENKAEFLKQAILLLVECSIRKQRPFRQKLFLIEVFVFHLKLV